MFVYVLESSVGKLYVGVTRDVARRLQEHNDGKSAQSLLIKGKDNFRLRHTWEVRDTWEAYRLEKYLHQLQRVSDSFVYDAMLDTPLYCKWLQEEVLRIPLTQKEKSFCNEVYCKSFRKHYRSIT